MNNGPIDTSPNQQSEHLQKLALLRDDYISKLPEKLRQIETLWSKLCFFNWSLEAVRVLHNLVHGLAGSGRVFGLPALSDTAQRMEIQVQNLLQSGRVPDESQKKQIDELVAALHTAAQLQQAAVIRQAEKSPDAATKVATTRGGAGRLVFVVDDDPHVSKYLAAQLQAAGYTVRTFHQLVEMYNVISETPPAAVVLDVVFPEGSLAGIDAVEKIRATTGTRTPILFTSARSDVTARLRALRAGGDAYFIKPIDASALVAKLDEFISSTQQSQSRVLVVNDDAALGEQIKTLLEQHGFLVNLITQPLDTIQAIVRFKPDLMVMQIEMSDVGGLELAGVIRQQDYLVDLPIVFVSNTDDIAAREKATALGISAFLTKPVEEAELLAVVRTQVGKSRAIARQIRSASQTDPQTGLANRKYFLAQLEQAIARAGQTEPVQNLAYLALDHFEEIREQIGIMGLDSLHEQLAEVIQDCMADAGLASQLSDGNFAILTQKYDESAVMEFAQSLCDAVAAQPITVGNETLNVTCSAAVLTLGSEINSVKEALLKVEAAAEAARRAGGNQAFRPTTKISEFVSPIGDAFQQQQIVEALKNKAFRLVFQPILSVGEEGEDIFEVLLRLNVSEDKAILPEQFYPIAEAKGMLNDIERWTIEHAIDRLSGHGRARASAKFFIKLSPATLSIGTFLPWISNCLSSSRLRGEQQIVFEMSEKNVITRISEVSKFANGLKQVNCGFAINQFGNSDSSFELLNKIPVDYIKVGEPFTTQLRHDASLREQLKSLTKAAWLKGIDVIAVGVDSPQTMAQLWDIGVRHFQGYYVEDPHESLEFDFRKAAERYLRA